MTFKFGLLEAFATRGTAKGLAGQSPPVPTRPYTAATTAEAIKTLKLSPQQVAVRCCVSEKLRFGAPIPRGNDDRQGAAALHEEYL